MVSAALGLPHFDAPWNEWLPFVVAVLATLIRPLVRLHRGHPFRFRQNEVIYDCLSGAAIVPFLFIIGALFSSDMMQTALMSNRELMGLGGFIGLIVVLGDYFKDPGPPPPPGTVP